MFNSKLQILYYVLLGCVSMFMQGCGQIYDADKGKIDSLNDRVNRMKYASLDSALLCADEILALYEESGYRDGIHEAMLNKGSVFGLQMDYDSAQYYYKEVLDHTNNDLMKSMADVDMMSVCLVTSMNKEFYDYRSDAHERFVNVEEETACMDEHQKMMWNSVVAKYHFVSLNYFLKMRQKDGAKEEFKWLQDNRNVFSSDSTLLANYLFLSSVYGSWNESETGDEIWYSQLGLLSLSRLKGYVYFEILAANSLAKNILQGGELKPSRRVLIEEVLGVEDGADLSYALATHGLMLAKQYGNDYLTGMVLITLSDYYLQKGQYEAALMQVEEALQLINAHHKKKYGTSEEYADDILYTYLESGDTLSTELKWIADPYVTAVPEWMALVREQLSVVYGAMGLKQESDYNHNIYFDILDATRQDLRVQQEEEHLQEEERLLNFLLVLFAVVIIALSFFLFVYNKKSRVKYQNKVKMLGEVIDICKHLPNALTESIEDEDELDRVLHEIADRDVVRIFPQFKDKDWTKDNLKTVKGLDGEIFHVLLVFYRWVREKGIQQINFTVKKELLDSKTYLTQRKLEEDKRRYLEKLTSMTIVNGITPFLDRALHEVSKLKATDTKENIREKFIYLGELIDKINEYNIVLGYWVKIRQGILALNVENFALQPLFNTLKQSYKAFEMKNISLSVDETDGVVKADKALTFFMMNTLLDNARKYTPQGGKVTLSTKECETYIEIFVKDTGYGMSEQDIEILNNSKVYDSNHIGAGNQHVEDIRQNKGFGFGLMNCKGIIEKYKKTGAVFSVCTFGVESEQGKGSRFFFRLPKGVLKNVCSLLILLFSCVNVNASEFLKQAMMYTDSVFTANVHGRYNDAIAFADSSVLYFNQHYLKTSPNADDENLMQLIGRKMAELVWFQEGFDTNYESIIMLRNEVAIAALALNQNKLYHYNNEILTQLYTLTSTDPALEDYCNSIKSANRNKKTILILLGTAIFLVITMYYFLHYRHHLLFIFNLRQFVRLNNAIFTSSDNSLMQKFHENLSDIKQCDTVGLMTVSEENAGESRFVFAGDETKRNVYESLMLSAYQQKKEFVSTEGGFHAYPLCINDKDELVTGVIGVCYNDVNMTEEEQLIIHLVIQFMSIHSYFSFHKAEEMNELLELKEDERIRIEHEQQKVYVRNQILDNCLSTLKHETMYYPNRIKQIVDAVIENPDVPVDSRTIDDIKELISYYKEIFTLLSTCASKQMETVLFKRTMIPVQKIADMAMSSFSRQQKKNKTGGRFYIAPVSSGHIYGDAVFLQTLIDNIISLYFEHNSGGDLQLGFDFSDSFAKFAFTDTRYQYTEEEISQVFYIDNVKYDDTKDTLTGVQYLLCRQIIREHDAYSPNRGCRLYVENQSEENGSTFNFTLPLAN